LDFTDLALLKHELLGVHSNKKTNAKLNPYNIINLL